MSSSTATSIFTFGKFTMYSAPIDFGLDLLTAKALDLADGHALDPDLGQRLADFIDLERLDDGLIIFMNAILFSVNL